MTETELPGSHEEQDATDAVEEIAPDEEGSPDLPGFMEAPLPEAPIIAILEALLFASDQPVTAEEVNALVGGGRLEEVAAALRELAGACLNPSRGLRVQAIAGGYRISTDPGLGPYVREMVRARNRQRLSRAALETLAIVAYKQPITGPEIQEIRGVNPSAILSALLDRRLVRILGRKKVVGKPFLYGTTRDFLVRFGLNSLEDLPSMEEFDAMLQEQSSAADISPAGEATVAESHEETAGDIGEDGDDCAIPPEQVPSMSADGETGEVR